MEKINLLQEILKHNDDEIIAYLYDKMSDVRRLYADVQSTGDHPELLYTAAPVIETMHDVLRALNRRNAEKYV